MKPRHARRRTGGFTGWDLLIVVVVLGLLAALLLPAVMRPHRPKRGGCISNLKQIGLAFRMWANDHGDLFPMHSSTFGTNGGTMEFALTGEVWRHYRIMSNELSAPKILTCYSDQRIRATEWSGINNQNLSYFIGLDADETRPQTILSGDRNLESTAPSANGVLSPKLGDRLAWSQSLHNKVGNFAMADGSVQQVNSKAAATKQLELALQSTGRPAHRLALPE